MRRSTDQLARPSRRLCRTRTLRGSSLHCGRRAAHLRRHVLLAAVASKTTAQRPCLARHAPDRRPDPRDLDAGRGDDAAEAARLRDGGGRAAHLRRRHQAQPRAPAARHRHQQPRRRLPLPGRTSHPRHAGRPAPSTSVPSPGTPPAFAADHPEDPPAPVQTPPRHQMKASPYCVTLNRLLFHVMKLVYRLYDTPSWIPADGGIVIMVRTYPDVERTFCVFSRVELRSDAYLCDTKEIIISYLNIYLYINGVL